MNEFYKSKWIQIIRMNCRNSFEWFEFIQNKFILQSSTRCLCWFDSTNLNEWIQWIRSERILQIHLKRWLLTLMRLYNIIQQMTLAEKSKNVCLAFPGHWLNCLNLQWKKSAKTRSHSPRATLNAFQYFFENFLRSSWLLLSTAAMQSTSSFWQPTYPVWGHQSKWKQLFQTAK